MQRQYTQGAVPRRSLDTTIAAGDTSVIISDGTSWPSTGPFWITIERDTVNEERILIASRAGATLTVASSGRGRDGTTARSHTAGSSTFVEHTLAGEIIDTMNEALAIPTTKGDLLGHNGTALVRKGVGTNGFPLVARSTDSAGVAYEELTATGLANNAVTTAKILDDAVTSAKIAPGTIAGSDIANDAIDSQHYATGSIDAEHLADDAVTAAKIGFTLGGVTDTEATSITVTNTVTQTALSTMTIPAGEAVAGMVYDFFVCGSILQATGSDQTCALTLFHNGNQVAAYTPTIPSAAAPNLRSWSWHTRLFVINPATSQHLWNRATVSNTYVGGTNEALVSFSAVGASSFLAENSSSQATVMTGSHTLELRVTWPSASTSLSITALTSALTRSMP